MSINRELGRRVRLPRKLSGMLAVCASVFVGPLAAQDCSGELPMPPEPALERCGALNVACRLRNEQKRENYAKAARQFTDPIQIRDSEHSEELHRVELQVRGCRGATVVPELEPGKLRWVRYDIIAPSGALVTAAELHPQEIPVRGKSLLLPETGYYTIRLSTRAPGENKKHCEKSKGLLECEQWGTRVVYPRDFGLRFIGSMGAPALMLGETAEGTVTPGEPFSRLLRLDPDTQGGLTVSSLGGIEVAVRVESKDGTLIADRRGTQHFAVLGPRDREETYVLTVVLPGGGAPTGISVRYAEIGRGGGELRAGELAEGQFTGLPVGFDVRDPNHAKSARSLRNRWTFRASRPGTLTLTAIPSGRSGLAIRINVYHAATEEVISRNIDVRTRTRLPLKLPAAGEYVVEVEPLSITESEGTARYTLQIGT